MNPPTQLRHDSPILAAASFGEHLRAWRRRRRLSQLDLATEAEISTRHLSYVETGRAIVAANRIVPLLLSGVDPKLLQASMNVLRLTLDPLGLAPKIVNLTQWRAHLLERVGQQIAMTRDAGLISLLADLRNLSVPGGEQGECLQGEQMGIAVPLKLSTPLGVLSFISTTTIFGSPTDVTLQELALETFFPLDDFSKRALQTLAG